MIRAINISAQFGGPVGSPPQVPPTNGALPSVNVPPGWILTHISGTVSLKQAGEVLIVLVADGVPLWSGEFDTKDSDSWTIYAPMNPSWGQISTITGSYSYINGTQSDTSGGSGAEVQLTFYAL